MAGHGASASVSVSVSVSVSIRIRICICICICSCIRVRVCIRIIFGSSNSRGCYSNISSTTSNFPATPPATPNTGDC